MDINLKNPTPEHAMSMIHERGTAEEGPFKIIAEIKTPPGTTLITIKTEEDTWNRLAFRHVDGRIYGHSDPFPSPEERPKFEVQPESIQVGDRKYVGGRLKRANGDRETISAALFLGDRPVRSMVVQCTIEDEDTVVHAMLDTAGLNPAGVFQVKWVYEPPSGDIAQGWQPIQLLQFG